MALGDFIKRLLMQIGDFIGGLSSARKVAFGFSALVILGGIIFLFRWAGTTTYQPLMTNLNPEDSASVIRLLREKHVPFQVDPTGKAIEIPPEYIHDLRLELATQGMPQSSTVGYELFDQQSLGTTSYVQKVNYKRALEGELTRTISALRGVKRARVHLATPKTSTFVEDQKKSTASVVLELEPGITLNEKQIYGVGHLVASAVEGLEVSDVVIVESNGKVLSKNSRDPLVAVTADQVDFGRKIEEDYENRVVSLLEPVVGAAKVVARVTADVDFSQISETQTIYDGDATAVRSSMKDSMSMNGTRPGPGIAGARANTPGQDPNAPPAITSNTNKGKEINNYAVPQTVIQTKRPSGKVTKISVAVVVDGKEVRTKNEQGEVQAKVEPWTPEQLSEFEKIVSGALGLDKKRGDSLEVRNMAFQRRDVEESERLLAESDARAYRKRLLVLGVIGLMIVMFFLFVVRPFIKWLTENTIESVDSFLPQTIEELERIQKSSKLPGMEEIVPELPDKIDPEKVEGEMIKEKIITLVDANPHKAAMILREWVRAKVEKSEEGKKGDGKSA